MSSAWARGSRPRAPGNGRCRGRGRRCPSSPRPLPERCGLVWAPPSRRGGHWTTVSRPRALRDVDRLQPPEALTQPHRGPVADAIGQGAELRADVKRGLHTPDYFILRSTDTRNSSAARLSPWWAVQFVTLGSGSACRTAPLPAKLSGGFPLQLSEQRGVQSRSFDDVPGNHARRNHGNVAAVQSTDFVADKPAHMV